MTLVEAVKALSAAIDKNPELMNRDLKLLGDTGEVLVITGLSEFNSEDNCYFLEAEYDE